MRHLDEYRDEGRVRELTRRLASVTTRPWVLMEVCGGQTHAILRFGLDRLLPAGIELIHGPGCPVCVTPSAVLDAAVAMASRPGTVLCTFGDMLRVPGTRGDLAGARARGADVRVVYSPLDAVRMAEAEVGKEFVFLAVGFETTAPVNALAVAQAVRRGVGNFSMLVSQVRVPPVLDRLLGGAGNRVQGILAAGHVCTVMGLGEYEALVRRHRVPVVVTGFEPVDILDGVGRCVAQLEAGRAEVENAYARVVRPEGNPVARGLVEEVFEVVTRPWRGLGEIGEGGLGFREAYRRFDACVRFGIGKAAGEVETECQAGLVLQGLKRPHECPAFGTRCTPEHPLGAPMVSGEGACAAYHRYRGVA